MHYSYRQTGITNLRSDRKAIANLGGSEAVKIAAVSN